MTDHADILRRLEAAKGADREIDRAILRYLGFTWRGMDYWNEDRVVWKGATFFTHSLDAAIALVERKLRHAHPQMTANLKGIYSGDRVYWYAEITWPSTEHQGRGTTPALALLIALFRALEAGK